MKLPKPVGEPTVVWQGPLPRLIVARQDFEFPDGQVRDFYLWGKGGRPVVVLPITAEDEVILTRQWRAGSNCAVFEAPGGHPEPGQTPEQALAAELRQETGYEPERIMKLPELWVEPTSNATVVVPYLALGCRKVAEPEPEAGEFLETVLIPLSQWLRTCWSASDNTRDAKTLAIALLALPFVITENDAVLNEILDICREG